MRHSQPLIWTRYCCSVIVSLIPSLWWPHELAENLRLAAGVEKGTVQSGDASSSANHQADTQVGTFGRIESATGSHTCRSSRTLNVESKAYSVYSEWLAPDAGHSTDNRSTCQVRLNLHSSAYASAVSSAQLAAARAHGTDVTSFTAKQCLLYTTWCFEIHDKMS